MTNQSFDSETRWRMVASSDPRSASRLAIRSIARRHQELSAEIKALDHQMHALVEALVPDLLSRPGVGYETATTLLLTAGDNPDRLQSEATFAQLCGSLPFRLAQEGPFATGSTALATAKPTGPCSSSSSSACTATAAQELSERGWKLEAVTTDNASEYRAQEFNHTLAQLGVKHIYIRAGRPPPTAAWSASSRLCSRSVGSRPSPAI